MENGGVGEGREGLRKKLRENWRGRGEDLVWLGSEEAAVLQPAPTGITM